MKWLPPFGMVQMSKCGRYTVQHPTDRWIAYSIPAYGKPEKLGECESDENARSLCASHEAHVMRKVG